MPEISPDTSSYLHPAMCPCCAEGTRFLADNSSGKQSANEKQKHSLNKDINEADEKASIIARQSLLNEWLSKPGSDKGEALSRNELEERYDVKIEEIDGNYAYSYQADGKTHLLLQSEASEKGLILARQQLDSLAREKMQGMEEKYRVSFARTGEEGSRSYRLAEDCTSIPGEMIYARTPSLRQLHATELALQQSQPSQLNKDGKDGIKIYFLDGRPAPQVYGGKWPLGFHIGATENRKSQLVITLDGGKLPATDKDAEPNGRNLKWVVSHELTHNSQDNMWEDRMIPQKAFEQLGWSADSFVKDGKVIHQWQFALHGKNGEFFSHLRQDCKSPSVWFLSKEDTTPLNSAGKEVKSLGESPHFSNEEVMERAKVRPITYYFMNPREMISEGLTGFRYNRETREQLLKDSPQLYQYVKQYDETELARYYGADSSGKSGWLRMPSGSIAPRNNATEEEIQQFEKSNSLHQRRMD